MGKSKSSKAKVAKSDRVGSPSLDKKIKKDKSPVPLATAEKLQENEQEPNIGTKADDAISVSSSEPSSEEEEDSASSRHEPTPFAFESGHGYPSFDDLFEHYEIDTVTRDFKVTDEAKSLYKLVKAKAANVSSVECGEDGAGYECVISVRVMLFFDNMVTDYTTYHLRVSDFTEELAQVLLNSEDDGDANSDLDGDYQQLAEKLIQRNTELSDNQIAVHSATAYFCYDDS